MPPTNGTFWPILLPILTAIASAGVTILVTRFNDRKTRKKSLDDQLDNILKIAVQYPYLELNDFTSNWSKDKLTSKIPDEAERYQRYDIYTTLVFNYKSRLAEYHKYDSRKILDAVDIKTWVRTHKKIWTEPASDFENADGYSEEFRKLINSYIK